MKRYVEDNSILARIARSRSAASRRRVWRSWLPAVVSLGAAAAAAYACWVRTRRCGDVEDEFDPPIDPLVENDAVDEAAWESFPASDPPGYGVVGRSA